MYLILASRVLLGVDGFINDHILGSQVRVWIFGLNIWWSKGDKDPDGDGFEYYFGFPHINTIL